ncbi:hypothetical protein [Ralstonia pseudosolanacearum]|uniref:hypothetical protein n=1 Tax=Ralstonia pseudosolanacearum TaxID=1310165 RepID=UPI003AADD131
MFRKLIANDDAVKTIFDHFRNIGIAGTVFAAGVWSLKSQAEGLLTYMTLASGAALCVLGVFLLVLAERHGSQKLKEAHLPVYLEWTVVIVHSLALLTLFANAALKM